MTIQVIDADVLFSILDNRIKEAEEDARHAKRDVVAERADAVLSALESLKADIEDNVPTIDAVPKTQCRDCQFSGKYSGIDLRRTNATD